LQNKQSHQPEQFGLPADRSPRRKGGKQIKQEVEERSLSRVVRTLSALRGRRLFNAPDGNGTKRPITAREVNSLIAKAAGTDISAKDFRTFRASAAARASLTKRNGHDSKRSRAKAIVDAADEASEILANTRTVARSSYCKRTTQHGTVSSITGQDGRRRNARPEHTLNYGTARANMRIIELENRCTGNRTVGSNPPSPFFMALHG
jgi:DNA topoisomerase IB